ncbi:MAG: energy transducer TonB, partial [Sphingobacteriales bacterium]
NPDPGVVIFDPYTMPPPPVETPKPIEETHAAEPLTAKTIVNTEPVIVPPNVKPDIDPPNPDELKDAVSGPVNNPGTGGDATALTVDAPKGPAGTGDGGPATKGGGGGGLTGGEGPVIAADVMPEYPGGMDALHKFVSSHVVYPNAAREEGIYGKVVVKFVVDEDGSITKAVVVKGIGGGCDKEALRVVNAMPKWKPGKVKGRAVKVYYMLPISFTLNP